MQECSRLRRGLSVIPSVRLCQTPWDSSTPIVPRPFFVANQNKSNMKRVSIGQTIRAEFERQGHSVVWFSQQLCCDRTNIYRIFARDSIDTELLARISVVLKYNFFAELSAYTEKSIETKSQHICR